MLHEFLTSNRKELINRCREKVAKRIAPTAAPSNIDHGAPLLLQQIAEILRREQLTPEREVAAAAPTPAPSEIGRAAALHGAELLRLGYSIDQVVHDYGDVCQAVTELAVERKAPISADEFRTLNRCLDNAIADAVTSFGGARQKLISSEAQDLHARLKHFSDEQQRLVDIAIQSFFAMKSGNVGLTGATSTLLIHTLGELRALAERTLPEIDLIAEATTVPFR